jgi:hypothetical protein
MGIRRLLGIVAGALILWAGQSMADPIAGLYDTGVDSNGVSLPDGTFPDPHYTIISSADGSVASTTTVKTSASGYPVAGPPYWNADSSTSAWIMPSAGYPDNLMPYTYYDYLTTFTLPAGATSVSISANLVVDNEETNILLNGVTVGAPQIDTYTSLETYTPISFSSNNVLAGINDLVFVVYNAGGPTGLRVDGITGTYTSVDVPEPAGIGLIGFAAFGLLALSRKYRVAHVACGAAIL